MTLFKIGHSARGLLAFGEPCRSLEDLMRVLSGLSVALVTTSCVITACSGDNAPGATGMGGTGGVSCMASGCPAGMECAANGACTPGVSGAGGSAGSASKVCVDRCNLLAQPGCSKFPGIGPCRADCEAERQKHPACTGALDAMWKCAVAASFAECFNGIPLVVDPSLDKCDPEAEAYYLCLAAANGIDFLRGSGELTADPKAVSADGEVVVGNLSSPTDSEAFRWTKSAGMLPLGVPPAAGGEKRYADGISADGIWIVGQSWAPKSGATPFRWSVTSGFQGLGTLSTQVSDTNGDGSVIVGWKDGLPFRWTAATGPETIGSESGTVYAVSDDGAVSVGICPTQAGVARACRWTNSVKQQLQAGAGPFPHDFAAGVSADGKVAVGSANTSDGVTEAVWWDESGNLHAIGTLGSKFTQALAASADGQIIVGKSCPSPSSCESHGHGFVWDATNGMRTLEQVLKASGIELGRFGPAADVSADGSVVVGRTELFKSQVGYRVAIPK